MYPGERMGDHRGISFNTLIFLSFILHFLILLLLVYSPSLQAPQWTFGPVYSVQLVSMPSSPRAKKDADTSFKEIMDVATSSQPNMKKESVDALPSVPIAPVEVNKKSTDNLDTVLESIKKNIKAEPKTSATEAALKGVEKTMPAVPALPPLTSSVPGKQDRGGGEGLDGRMKNYYALIWSRIKASWTIPQGMMPKENVEVIIHTRILRDGTVAALNFEKRSGNRYFDESALRSVKKAIPFPPFPEGLRENSVEVGIRFRSSEFW